MSWARAGRDVDCRCGEVVLAGDWVRFGDIATQVAYCARCAEFHLGERPPNDSVAEPALSPASDTLFEGGRPSQRDLAMGPAEAIEHMRAIAEKGR